MWRASSKAQCDARGTMCVGEGGSATRVDLARECKACAAAPSPLLHWSPGTWQEGQYHTLVWQEAVPSMVPANQWRAAGVFKRQVPALLRGGSHSVRANSRGSHVVCSQAWIDAVSGAVADAGARDDILSLASCRFSKRLRLMSQLACLCSAANPSQAQTCVGPNTFDASDAPESGGSGTVVGVPTYPPLTRPHSCTRCHVFCRFSRSRYRHTARRARLPVPWLLRVPNCGHVDACDCGGARAADDCATTIRLRLSAAIILRA